MEPLPLAGAAAQGAVFRAAREALANVARHARATLVRVSLSCRDGDLCLEIADDGVGLPSGWRAVAGYGLRSLGAQIRRAGGSFRVEPGTAGGTVVRARVPAGRG